MKGFNLIEIFKSKVWILPGVVFMSKITFPGASFGVNVVWSTSHETGDLSDGWKNQGGLYSSLEPLRFRSRKRPRTGVAVLYRAGQVDMIAAFLMWNWRGICFVRQQKISLLILWFMVSAERVCERLSEQIR